MLNNLFKREEKKTGFEAKTNLRHEMLQAYSEFGVTTEAESKYVDGKLCDLAEAAAGLGMLTLAATTVIGAGAAAFTMAANSIENTKHKNHEKDRILDYRIEAITSGEAVETINQNCRVIKGKICRTLGDKVKGKVEAAKARLEAAKAAAGKKNK